MTALLDVRSPFIKDLPSEWPQLDPAVAAILTPVGGIYTRDQAEALETIARSRWFFLRNHGRSEGYSYRCANCKQIHDFFSLHCIARPFNGLTQAVGLLAQQITERDTDYLTVALGAIEPITAARARRHYTLLRDLGYPPRELLGQGGAAYSEAELRLMEGR